MENVNNKARRTIAAKEGKVTYRGYMCSSCGGLDRYVSNNNCVTCAKKHAKAYDKRQRELIKDLREKMDTRPNAKKAS